MTLIPFEQEEQSFMMGSGLSENSDEKKLNFKEHARKRIINLLRVMMKLASVNGYNENGNIKRRDGTFVENSDLSLLLLHAMSPGKILFGESEFLDLLRSAQVDPSLILNDNIREKLMRNKDQDFHFEAEPQLVVKKEAPLVETEIEKMPEMNPEPIEEITTLKKKKRRFDEVDDDEDEPLKKRKNELPSNWVIPRE